MCVGLRSKDIVKATNTDLDCVFIKKPTFFTLILDGKTLTESIDLVTIPAKRPGTIEGQSSRILLGAHEPHFRFGRSGAEHRVDVCGRWDACERLAQGGPVQVELDFPSPAVIVHPHQSPLLPSPIT